MVVASVGEMGEQNSITGNGLMTEGRQTIPAEGRASRERLARLLVAALAALTAMVMALLLIPNVFPSNDDFYAQEIMAGVISPEPAGYITFINYGLCWLVSRLFVVLPGVPWWTLAHLFAQLASLTLAGYVALGLRHATDDGRRLVRDAVVLCLAEACLFGVLVARMQFTTTGSLLMAAAIFCSCAWLLVGKAGIPGIFSGVVAPAVLGGLGYAFRVNSGYLGLGFWACAIMGVAIVAGRGGVRARLSMVSPAVRAFAGALCLCVACAGIHYVAYDTSQWSEERAQASALASFTDYPRIPYERDPERYESVGWDSDLLELAGEWYFMDDRINTETLSHINDGNETWLVNLLEDPAGTLRLRLAELVQPVSMGYLVLLASVAACLAYRLRGRGALAALVPTVIVVVVAGLLGYLVVRGRLPERALLSVVVPALACLAALSFAVRDVGDALSPLAGGEGRHPGRGGRAAAVACASAMLLACLLLAKLADGIGMAMPLVAALICLMLLVRLLRGEGPWRAALCRGALAVLVVAIGASMLWQYGWTSENHALMGERAANIGRYYDYVEEHPDTLFIQDYSSALTPQDPWQMRCPANQTSWGGWRYNYEWFDEAMRKAGFGGTPTSDDLLREDVRFVSGSRHVDETMERYLEGLYGPVTFVEEWRLERTQERDDIVVYRIVPS